MKKRFKIPKSIIRIAVLVIVSVICIAAMDWAFFYPQARTDDLILEVGKHYKDRLDGLGVEWDPMLLASYNTANPTLAPEDCVTEEDFEKVCAMAEEIGIDKIRCFWSESWIEPVNDNDDPHVTNYDAFIWDQENILTLFKQLDFCQKEGIKVNLTTWGGSPFPITEHEEYAECMCVMLEKVIEKGYTCVVEMTPFNEPCWAYKVDGVVDMEDHWQSCRVLDSMLKERGLRKKIKLNLSDNNYSLDSMRTMEELGRLAEIYNTHSYDYISPYSDTAMTEFSQLLTRYAHKNGAIHLVNEFGPNTVINAMTSSDTDTYKRGLLISRVAVNFLNGGTAGLLYWCLTDQYYGVGSRMSVGLYQFKDKGWEARPQLYAYSLLTKYTQAGAKIYPIILDEAHLCAIALKNPDRSWTYAVINSDTVDMDVSFANPHLRSGKMDRYVYCEETLPTDSHPIRSDAVLKINNGLLSDTVRSQCMNVYHLRSNDEETKNG
ncbi:MAG: hypothetical protein II748_05765 [Clostridia bacterium]|nr:hypothetical protein [Clostridia bacterium]